MLKKNLKFILSLFIVFTLIGGTFFSYATDVNVNTNEEETTNVNAKETDPSSVSEDENSVNSDENTSDENTLENTLKKVSIENIQFATSPKLGEPKLYFKSINDFAKSNINEDNIISDSFEFNISSSDEANLSTPTLYNNLANPLTFSYVNSNIKSDYTITDVSSPITYDGSLLQKCNVNLEDIACTVSFDVYITNNLDQNFKTTVSVNIPLSYENKTIFDGSLTVKQDTNYIFYRYN